MPGWGGKPRYGNNTGPMTFWLARCMEIFLLLTNKLQFMSSSFHFGRISKSDRRHLLCSTRALIVFPFVDTDDTRLKRVKGHLPIVNIVG